MLVKFDSKNGFSGIISSIKELNGVRISDDLINSFKKMDTDGVSLLERNIDKLSKRYKITEVSAIEYMNAVKDGSIQLKDGQTMLQGYQSHLQSTSKSLSLANLGTKALTVSMKVFSTIGWMAIMTFAMKVIGKGIEVII